MPLDPSAILANALLVTDPARLGGDVVVPAAPVPCVVRAEWGDGTAGRHEGVATAWCAGAVEVAFSARGGTYRGVWVEVGNVGRRGSTG